MAKTKATPQRKSKTNYPDMVLVVYKRREAGRRGSVWTVKLVLSVYTSVYMKKEVFKFDALGVDPML
jgi:hypothetical protein